MADTLTCKYCKQIYKDPVFLNCCGKHICKEDLNKILKTSTPSAKCPFCDHEIQNQNFKINETLQILINQFELHKVIIKPEHESIYKSFKEKIEIIERMHKDPDAIIDKKFSELRRLIDLDKECAILKIKKLADDFIDRLNSFEKECKSECKSKAFLDYYSELIENMNKKLNKYEKCLKSLINSDEYRAYKSRRVKEKIRVLDLEISEYEKRLLKYKSIQYESMKDILQIKNVFGKLLVSR